MGRIYNALALKNLIVSAGIISKLKDKHAISIREVEQCFENREGGYLEDTREDHRTDPPTEWFVAPTNKGRLLKVVFVFRDGNLYLKSAFVADDAAIAIYRRFAF